MKTVDLTTDISPWRKGDSVPLPDDVADRLVKSGEAENIRPFPDKAMQAEIAETPETSQVYKTRAMKGGVK